MAGRTRHNHVVITAGTLVLLCDPEQGLVMIKVLDVDGRTHRLLAGGFQMLRYLRGSDPLPDSLWADLPQLPTEADDWDDTGAHVMLSLTTDTSPQGLVVRGESQGGDKVFLILGPPCQALFRHYVQQCAPRLVDLARDHGRKH